MIEAIARLRKIADETEEQARAANRGRLVRSELIDMAVKWQWLAGEATKLCTKSKQLKGAFGICAECVEKCSLRMSA